MTNISVSEINSYLRCRRAWDLTSASRQSLRHKVTPKIFFVVGSAVHEAIDAQAAGKNPMEAFEAYVDKERGERIAFYYETTQHSPSSSEMEEFEDSVELARGLTKQYFNQYGWDNPLAERGLKYVATEVPFSIPILPDVNFVGTFDGIATDLETESKFYLVENKTAGQKPKLEAIQSGNQYQGYNWAFRALTGHTPAGTLYNGVIKRIIKEPRVLKSGELSKDKSAGVTFQSFMSAIDKGGYDPVKYIDYIAYLEEREMNGDDRFFVREMFTYSNAQLDNWAHSVLQPIAQEMTQSPKVYPNFTSCDSCLVKNICEAMQFGEDSDGVRTMYYEVKTYGTMQAVDSLTPSAVGSVEDLIEVLNGSR